MNKYRIVFLFIFPVVLTAGNIELALNKHNGLSSYVVQTNDSQNLKSRLDFPFNFITMDSSYTHSYESFNIKIYNSFLLNSLSTQGEDFDWQNDNLTVYSQSNNRLDKYNNFGIELSKTINENFDTHLVFNYMKLNFIWSDTYQEDYVKNETKKIYGDTLKFDQEIYKYSLGFNYKRNLSSKINLNIKPSIIYAFINTKDTHLLRSFYTKQNISTFAYGFKIDLDYKINQYSNLKLFNKYEKIEEQNVKMKYYNSLDINYLSYDSLYLYKNNILGLSYIYKF